MARIVRAIQPQVVFDRESGGMITVNPKSRYDSNDPIVKAYPWLFAGDNDEAPVERATRRPGERRVTRRPRKAAEPEQTPAASDEE